MAIFCVGTAVAQSGIPARPGPWQFSAFGGSYFGGKLYSFKGALSDDVRLKDTGTYGLRLGYDASPRLGFEVSWARAHPDVAFETSPRGTIGRVPLNTYEINANLYVGGGSLREFLTIGAGGAYISPYVPGARSGDTNFTANVGVGLKAFFDRHVALRFDGRFRETYANISPRLQVYCDSSGCYYYKRNWYLSYEASAGLVYAF